ncbi:MAG: hypothetical protein A2W26_03225 [Acidobacteria bacterium RBG_16_64_8]|nr:MAG: hypothetical protein A2W26_03225 [Acidobacteria bacterium RBG_16_64_8]
MNDVATRKLEDLIGTPCFCPDGKPSPYCPLCNKSELAVRVAEHVEEEQFRTQMLEEEYNEADDRRRRAEDDIVDTEDWCENVIATYSRFPCPSCGAPGKHDVTRKNRVAHHDGCLIGVALRMPR